MNNRLTEKSYWDSVYLGRDGIVPVNLCGVANKCYEEIYSIKKKIGIENKNVLEIGGGGSAWLAYLSRTHPDSTFTCLDYSEQGVAEIQSYANENELRNLFALNGDLFEAVDRCGKYDLVYSHGVAEHFSDLAQVLRAKAAYLDKAGRLLTVIPNMSGILGVLTKKMNREVYDLHVAHDLLSFQQGHKEAGLKIIESGYLCSTNFGVLSSCVDVKYGIKWFLYVGLATVSRILWAFERSVTKIPASRLFSPYIYVVAENDEL
nr:methyltransferase [Oceanococcus sp. HetDA_MAG_MS8]